jgi:hypothetical protein
MLTLAVVTMVISRREDELEPATFALFAVAVMPPRMLFFLFKMPCRFFGQTTEALLSKETALK